MFVDYPLYNPRRVLVDRTTWTPPRRAMQGEDVYALQAAINLILSLGTQLVLDGILGPRTGSAIWVVQGRLQIKQDGKAGPETQGSAAKFLLARHATGDLYRVALGHLIREASLILGNKSAKRPDPDEEEGWSADFGVAQMNSAHTDPRTAFNPPMAIPLIVASTTEAYRRYSDLSKFDGDDHSTRRRWMLATGSWNAPAWAQWLAGFRDRTATSPPPAARETFEEYMLEAVALL